MSKIKLINVDDTYADTHKNWYVLYGTMHSGERGICKIFNGNEYELDYVKDEANEMQGGMVDHDYNFSIAGYDSPEEIKKEES